MRRKLTIAILALTALVGTWQLTTDVSAQQKLTLAMVLTGLQTQGKTPETSTLAKRNIYITQRVKTYGVTFRLTADLERELRNAGATTVLIETIRRYGPATSETPIPAAKPNVVFKESWVEYGTTESGVKGMTFHLKFSANRMKGVASFVAIYFQDSDGAYLKDSNSKYRSGAGEVAVYRELDPCCDVTDYDDLDIFMPYGEFDVPDGNWDLTADIKVIYKAGGIIGPLTKKAFNYKQSTPVERDSSLVTTTVKRVWIDYNVKQGGRNGMRVHVNFEVGGLKNVDSKLTFRLAKSDNTYVDGDSSAFSNDDGALQVDFAMKPGYDPASFSDASVFIPYDEISIAKGKWNLRVDIDLNYEDGEIIKHLHFEPITFTQP